MEGAPEPPELRGIIPNAFLHIFDKVALAGVGQQFLVRASYLEIYNEEVRDLLSKDPKNHLELKENLDTGVYVKDLTTFVVKSAIEIDQVMQSGKKNRSVGSTLMNQASSRSHSIFTIVCECAEQPKEPGGKPSIRVGKLNLVDLAGSERQSKTGATGDRLKEATKINMSLSSLGNVISALVDGKSQHIPYRDSKLTRLLQDSLGGNTKTVMCANCGPATYNYDETVSTLRYANRAKNIKNKPKINEDPKDAMLREFQEEIERLKQQLDASQSGRPVDGYSGGGGGGGGGGGERIVEKIVEVEKLVEVKVGASPEELAELKAAEEKAIREKEELRKQAASDMKQLLDQQTSNAKERADLESKLLAEQRDRELASAKKKKMEDRLKAMEAKLIQGGKMMDMAAIQEAELREANLKLAQKHEEERRMQVEMKLKEEQALAIEEQFGNVQEEVEMKTKKLKKLWLKFQESEQNLKDEKKAFQLEKEDMLDTIRALTSQLKLKNLILDNFIPASNVEDIESRAVWNKDKEDWDLPRLDIAGNQVRPRRVMSAANLRRPESEYSRQRKSFDPSSRYKYDNILGLDNEVPERATQEYEGPDMVSRVTALLSAPLNVDESEIVPQAVDSGPRDPYHHYPDDGGDNQVHRSSRRSSSGSRHASSGSSVSSKSRSGSKGRPSTASRRARETGMYVEE